MPKYYQAENTGKGFITHGDQELAHISGYPGDVWVTESGGMRKEMMESDSIFRFNQFSVCFHDRYTGHLRHEIRQILVQFKFTLLYELHRCHAGDHFGH